VDLLDFYAGDKNNYIVYLETKKRYHSIFIRFHYEPILL